MKRLLHNGFAVRNNLDSVTYDDTNLVMSQKLILFLQ